MTHRPIGYGLLNPTTIQQTTSLRSSQLLPLKMCVCVKHQLSAVYKKVVPSSADQTDGMRQVKRTQRCVSPLQTLSGTCRDWLPLAVQSPLLQQREGRMQSQSSHDMSVCLRGLSSQCKVFRASLETPFGAGGAVRHRSHRCTLL